MATAALDAPTAAVPAGLAAPAAPAATAAAVALQAANVHRQQPQAAPKQLHPSALPVPTGTVPAH
eukprot:scaffold205696_cov17-Tisochrysis_lutea.AAC.2